jgi:hypothetical protein
MGRREHAHRIDALSIPVTPCRRGWGVGALRHPLRKNGLITQLATLQFRLRCDGSRYRFVTASLLSTERERSFDLIRCGGDDGTRTHDPLLANTPELDDGEQWRTTSPDQSEFTDGGGWQRMVADVRQMFDRAAIRGPRYALASHASPSESECGMLPLTTREDHAHRQGVA